MRVSILLTLVVIVGVLGCDKAELTGAKAEVKKTDVKLDLPAVPKFDVPSKGGDTRSVVEMRVSGHKLLKATVAIRGYITWIYDCALAGDGPKGPIGDDTMTIEEKRKLIEEDPMLCYRPHFYMGDTPDVPPHQSLWVVEVPRELRKDELKAWKRTPEDMREPLPVVVPHAVGDEVVVTGKWDKTSPRGFANSDGLLVYGSMENITNPLPVEEPKK